MKKQNCDIWIDGFIVCIKLLIFINRFDTSNYQLEYNSIDTLSSKVKNKIIIGLMKDGLGGNIMTKFFGLRVKAYSYLVDYCSEDKKQKAQESVL